MAAQNPALTQLLTALNAPPHPTMGTDFFAHVGSHMALARTIPPAWFPKTGSATEAQIGGLEEPGPRGRTHIHGPGFS